MILDLRKHAIEDQLGARWVLYFHTIRHLRPIQIYWQVWRKLATAAAPDRRPAPARRQSTRRFEEFPRKRRSMLAADSFRFLNREEQVSTAADWNNTQRALLWSYNLHYFDDLCAEGAVKRADWHQALVTRWITENPIGRGCGWDPYPTSLRIVNWIKWALVGVAINPCPTGAASLAGRSLNALATSEADRVGCSFSALAIQSLAVQVRYLAPRLEWHLLGNHLFANAKALVFAGCFFDGPEAREWLTKGVRILATQLGEQVLADGGHFERSPMYHAIVLEDLLDLINLSHRYPGVMPEKLVHALQASAKKMLRWAGLMTHPDGGIAFFNDAALGVAASFVELARYGERLGLPSTRKGRESSSGLTRLAESGYIRMQRGDFVVIFDAAPVGPDYLPGHAHADTLSFELSYGGQRVVCNSGTSQYGRAAMRQWERSTAAHNTVEIDGENSSEVWDSFRVARRAYSVALSCSEEAEVLRASCAHDGYTRLPGRPIHRRTVEVSANTVKWTDEVKGAGEHRAVGRIPLHPDVTALRLGEAQWQLDLPSGERLLLAVDTAGVRLDEAKGRFAPEFGLTLDRTVLVWTVTGTTPFSVAVSLRHS